jgi:hypothetical protein
MNRTDSAIFGAGRIQLFHSVKMDSIRPLSATLGNGWMEFYSASSFSIRPKSAKMADKSATWQPCSWSRLLLTRPSLSCSRFTLEGGCFARTVESRLGCLAVYLRHFSLLGYLVALQTSHPGRCFLRIGGKGVTWSLQDSLQLFLNVN